MAFRAAKCAAVHGIGEIRTKMLKREKGGAVSDLFIRREADGNPAVGQPLAVDFLAGGQNLGNARLIVGPEDRRPVRCDQGVSLQLFQLWEVVRREDPTARAQRKIFPVIIRDDPGADIYAGKVAVGNRIQVGDQGDAGIPFSARGGRQEAVHIGMFIHLGITEAEPRHLFFQKQAQIPLAFG